jgi:hypothetical protein
MALALRGWALNLFAHKMGLEIGFQAVQGIIRRGHNI